MTRHLLQKCLLTIFLIVNLLTVYGQEFKLFLDPITPFQSSITNLSILSNGNYQGKLIVIAELYSQDGQLLLKDENSITISRGETISLRTASLSDNAVFLEPSFSNYFKNNGSLPPLDYQLCVSLYSEGDIGTKARDCIEAQSSDFINLSSIYPIDQTTLSEQRPIFQWLNPLQSSTLTYHFRLVKIENKQNPNAALRRNLPIVDIVGLSQSSLTYPMDAEPLIDGEEYAWSISTIMDDKEIGSSPTWTFKYQESDTLNYSIYNKSYVDITELGQANNLFAVGKFKFKYPSDINSKLEIELYSTFHETPKKIELEKSLYVINPGVNKFDIDLYDQVYLKHKKDYRIIIHDLVSEREYQIDIQYLNPDFLR